MELNVGNSVVGFSVRFKKSIHGIRAHVIIEKKQQMRGIYGNRAIKCSVQTLYKRIRCQCTYRHMTVVKLNKKW